VIEEFTNLIIDIMLTRYTNMLVKKEKEELIMNEKVNILIYSFRKGR